MTVFIRRVAESHHLRVVDEGGLQGFAHFYAARTSGSFSRLAQELDDAAKVSSGWLSSNKKGPTGLSASLDESGCKALQAAHLPKGSQEMPIFIRRVAESRLYGIGDEGGLQGFAKYYSGQA